MDDLRRRFATLDLVPVPDVWTDVERRLEALAVAVPTGRLDVVTPEQRRPIRAGSARSGDRLDGRRRGALLAAAALLAALLIGAIAIGSGLVRLTSVVPPSPLPSSTTAPAVTATEPVPSASPVPSPSPTGPLGGRLIIAHDWVGQYDHGPYDVYAVDAGTGTRTLLGTLPGGSSGSGYAFHRTADRRHVLIIDNSGNVNGLIASLESPTEASRTLGFIASRDVAWIAGDRGNGNVNGDYAEGYALSPHGDRIAAIQVDEFDRPKRLIVLDVGGSGVQEIALPSGVKSAFVRSWSPDESAILVSGCRPCNKAQSPSEHQTAEHSHLYIVPLDGSPWRELLDADNEYLDATWSPDGSTLAVTHGACVAGTHMPRCPPGYSTLSLLNLQDETERPITAPTESAEWAAWSPDGRRIAFIGGKAGEILKDGGVFVVDADGTGPIKLADTNSSTPTVWSPDGQWLLYQKTWTEWWVVSVIGGQPRLFGAYGGVTW
jgi:hypothetical protein